MRKYHLLNNKQKPLSINEINELGLLPLLYKGNMVIFTTLIENLIEKYPDYKTFIKDYFVKNKLK